MTELPFSPPHSESAGKVSPSRSVDGTDKRRNHGRFLVRIGGFFTLILLIGCFGYVYIPKSIPSLSWWFVPIFWGTLLLVALTVRLIVVRKRKTPPVEPGQVVGEAIETETTLSETASPSRKIKRGHLLGIGVILVAVAGFAYVFLSGRIQTPDLPPWSVPVFWCLLLLLAAVPFFRKRVSGTKESMVDVADTPKPQKSFRIKIGKRFILIALATLAGLGLVVGVAYAFLSGTVSVAMIPGWAFPAFWCAVLAAAVTPKIYQSIAHRPVRDKIEGQAAKVPSTLQWGIDRSFGIKAALSVVAILLLGLFSNLYFAGKVSIPDFSWWSGTAFWTLAIAVVTAPRIYRSLPSVAKNADRLSSGGVESTTWILLVGGLFLINAVLIRSDAAQDVFFVDLTRFFDTRFFTPLHWCFFLIGAGGYFVAYFLNTRILVAEHEERPAPNLVFASKLSVIVGSTFCVLFVATKFSLFEPLIRVPFSNDLPLRYWSFIWLAIIVEIALLLYPNFRQELREAIRTNIAGPLKSFSWGVVPLAILGLVVVGGVTFLFVSGTVRMNEMPWWVGPIFWSLVIATALAPKISAALTKRSMKLRPGSSTRTLPKPGLKTLLLAVAALIPIGLVVGIGYAFYSETIRFKDLPSWTMPAFWTSIIVLGITYRVVESVRAYLKEAGPRRRSMPSVKSKEAAKQTPVFNASAKRRGFQRSSSGFSLSETFLNLGPLAWAIPVGIVAVSVIGWLGYSLLTMQRLDADGHPIPMPGWVIPAISGLVILAVVVVKIVMVLRDNSDGQTRPTSRPVQKPKAPAGFNASAKQKTVRPGSGFTWPSLPNFSGLTEFGPMLGLIAIGLVGLVILGVIVYFFSTMQWLDEDGHPVSMPFWVWPLLCLLAALGVGAWKVITALRENSGSSFRSRPVKPSRAAGFNTKGNTFGKKKGSFNSSSGSENLFANPMLWFGILGGAVVLLLLVIILILIF